MSTQSLPPPATDCDRLIRDIQARPEIWMARHAHYKNKVRLDQQWKSIQQKYPELTVQDLKRRWKNLRDSYRKEIRRLPQTRPGVPAETFKSNWKYFNSLSFLKDVYLIPYKGTAGVDDEFDFGTGSKSPGSQTSIKSDDETESPASVLKRKEPSEIREEFLKLERKKMKILEQEIARSNEHMKSDNYNFLMSLLPEMDKLGPLQKMRLRTKINQAVFDEVIMSINGDDTNYSEVHHIRFQEAPMENGNADIKEEAINMYE